MLAEDTKHAKGTFIDATIAKMKENNPSRKLVGFVTIRKIYSPII